jgi:hypothetical protein
LDIIGRSKAFSENRFQVSGVRFQAGSHFFTTDTLYETTPKWHGFLMIEPPLWQLAGTANRRISKDGIALLSLFKIDRIHYFDIRHSLFDIRYSLFQSFFFD